MDEVQTEANTGGMGGLVALTAVQQHLRLPELVLVHIS